MPYFIEGKYELGEKIIVVSVGSFADPTMNLYAVNHPSTLSRKI